MIRTSSVLAGAVRAGVFSMAVLAAGCASSAGTTSSGSGRSDSAAVVVAPVPVSVPVASARTERSVTAADTARAGRFDSGKMWTFEYPPRAYFEGTYGFTPTDEWFERARLGALRIPSCSASFVSEDGLILTNHHCSRGHLPSVSRPGENLLEDGFYAPTQAEERRASSMYADQLIAIEDVTDEVYAALEGAETAAEQAAAREEVIASIQDRLKRAAGSDDVVVQVVSLYNGGRYSAYTFRRYEDVRLVLIPELQLGMFGGDPDNFTYPRYSLDMTFWRAYDRNGNPVRTEHYFPFSAEAVREGEAVFVIGNPGSTSRLQTVAQLEQRRDLSDRVLLDMLRRRVEVLQAYVDKHPDELAVRNQLFSFLNSLKFYTGSLEGLNDPTVIAKRRDAEKNFLEALRADAGLQSEYGTLIDDMRAVQEEKLAYANDYEAFLSLGPSSSIGSTVLRRAVLAYPYLSQGAPADTLHAWLAGRLQAVPDQPVEIQIAFVADRFRAFQRLYGADSPMVRQILGDRTPEAAAEAVVRGSALREAATATQAAQSGSLTVQDPALQVVAAFWPRYQAFQSAWAGLSGREQELAREIGRAKFAVYGTELPPDATFSLRIADGVVAGYPYNGTVAPYHTTYYGLYDRYYSFGPGTDWDLPERWLDPPASFDLSTPINLVSTNDIIGGNSGSPLVNQNLELVGLVFDGNIESLSGAFIYLTDRARAVSVDAQGIIEALDHIYDADRIVRELRTGRLVPSEADADEQLQGGR